MCSIVPAGGVVIGGAVAMSSTAIIISQLTEQSENNRTHGRLAVAICLFQDLSFPLFLALVSALDRRRPRRRRRHIVGAIGIAVLALLLVLAAGRWLLRPLFLVIASVRSAELFSLACCSRCWPRPGPRMPPACRWRSAHFLAGMMLAETEFRHQIEATIRSYREVLLGLFFITVGMLLDVGCCCGICRWSRHSGRHAAAQGGGGDAGRKPATKSWFKSCAPAWS
jgi:CPA2 family monovalent cation:H+ antiporter-2